MHTWFAKPPPPAADGVGIDAADELYGSATAPPKLSATSRRDSLSVTNCGLEPGIAAADPPVTTAQSWPSHVQVSPSN